MISIVTAYYNRKELFAKTLESISKSSHKDFEVIAVDDGSDDKHRIEDLKSIYPFLKVIRLEPYKKWYSNSCIPFNLGFKAAMGDKVIIQNPECYHFGDIISYVDKNLNDKNYLTFGCYSLTKTMTEDLKNNISEADLNDRIENGPQIVKSDGEAGWYNHSRHRADGYHFCNAITKKNINELGGFDELYSFGIGYDDNELYWRVRLKKLDVKFIDNPFVLHQNHYSPSSLSYENRINKEILLKKNSWFFYNVTRKSKTHTSNVITGKLSIGKKKILLYALYQLEVKKKRIYNFINHQYKQIQFRHLSKTDSLIKHQLENPLDIPIIIINYNQLTFLKKLIDFLTDRNFTNIVIIDNNSDYPPLMQYYQSLPDQIKIEYQPDNTGHLVLFKKQELRHKYCKGFYVVTDSDIIPNPALPQDFMKILVSYLMKYFNKVTKVGFALDINDIPEYFPLKEKVLQWEKKFWKDEIENDAFFANIDTTFALYKPQYPEKFSNVDFFSGIRLGGDFSSKHGGWYIDPQNMTEDQEYYYEKSNNSASWKINK